MRADALLSGRFALPAPLAILLALTLTVFGFIGVAATPDAKASPLTFTDINPDVSTNSGANASTGGRVNGLSSASGNNLVFYAASEFGGVFKSTDGGDSWSRLNTHRPTVVWDVEVDPTNNNRVYATSFYDGRSQALTESGIQVSGNAGGSWTHPATATPPASDTSYTCPSDRRTQPSAFGIGIHPGNGDAYVGTNCGVALSTDGGATWSFVDPKRLTTPAGGGDATDVRDVFVQDDGTADGIVDVCGNDGVFRSTDGGNSWTSIAGNLPTAFGRCSIVASPDETYVLFLNFGGKFYQTNDGGTTWVEFTNPDGSQAADGGRIPFVAASQRADSGGTNRFSLWVGRGVNLERADCTTPASPGAGGANRCPVLTSGWTNVQAGAHADTGDVVFDTADATDPCPLVYSSDGGVHTNTVTGAGCHTPTWTRSNVGLHGLWLYAMSGADQPGLTSEDLYFGTQDNGSFAATNAGAAAVSWTNKDCCDVFNVVADSSRVVWDTFANYFQFYGGPGMTGQTEIPNRPPGGVPRDTRNQGQGIELFNFPDWIDQYGPNDYVGVNQTGAYFTNDITANPVTWTAIGTGAPGFCGVQASVSGGTPTFYAQTQCLGVFENTTPGQLWKAVGTGGAWSQIDDNDGLTGGFDFFAVDPNNPNRLYASNVGGPNGARMVTSTDGGATWDFDPDLDDLMMGGGDFPMQVSRGAVSFTGFGTYRQPIMVTYDQEDPDILVAGGRESGVFISSNSGADWALLTDPRTPDVTGIPHLPRPWYAYFDHEPADQVQLFLGTQGRGVWRVALPKADLQVSKSDSPDPVVAGNDLTYTVGVENLGLDAAGNVTMADPLPAETRFQSITAPAGWTCDTPEVGAAGEVRCTAASLAATATATFTITVRVRPSTPDGTTITDTARAWSNAIDDVQTNNSATTTTQVIARADMELVSKADSQDPAFAGENLTYTITARNNGPSTALNARVVDVLPSGVTYQTDTDSCVQGPTGTLTCSLGTMPPGDSDTFHITVFIARDLVHNNGSPLTITNTATADSDIQDPDSTNDQKTETTQVKAKADLEILSFNAVNPPNELIVGEPATVTLRKVITNEGPSAPMDVRVVRSASSTANATVNPSSTSHVEEALGYQEDRTVDEPFTIECTGPGDATFTFDNVISPDRPDDIEVDSSDNDAQTSFTLDCVVPIAINIHPGSFQNPINLNSKKGEVPVGALTTIPGEYGLPLAFDATTIDVPTVRFGPEAVVIAGGGALDTDGIGRIQDLRERSDERTRDGDRDMLLHHRIKDSQLTGSETEACIRGKFFGPGGIRYTFHGCDFVSFV